MSHDPLLNIKGRGALSNERARFEEWARESDPEYQNLDENGALVETKIRTTVWLQEAKSIISRNTSPDIPFDYSINPFQGCEHGCIYCFARPTHAYIGLSPGLDFESKVFAKVNSADLLRKELSSKSYAPKVIVLGANTDPYQPAERELRITRGILEILEEFNNPVSITTKSGLVVRDSDILGRMAAKGLARVFVSVTSLRNEISRTLEPRASVPKRRLDAVKKLSDSGIPVGVLVAPVIPAITDEELEAIVAAAANAGATTAAYILLRLPLEVADLFKEWLSIHYPQRAKHVLSILSQMRGGNLYDSRFGKRMRGTGVFADLLRDRFHLACKKNFINLERKDLRLDLFSLPNTGSQQMSLF
ncbi:PA0069 family radical SAM protein [Duganella sp. LX20W]|uniref:PA0069 family radical SAM protein n=1 Tax=Rugamonas brunnea TaxID=2758569 RepID=A0A7W2EVN7_9BURK|nr:PA0069 family radical SAM protein [Rugamonas brunnea]MBA5639459.1 PA0069 family radical SAM protein [Rugamonas brunnea]